MSRSYKKAILKDSSGENTKQYWRIVRSRWKNMMRSGVHPQDLPNQKSIVNDYDYIDHKYDGEYSRPLRKKWRRK